MSTTTGIVESALIGCHPYNYFVRQVEYAVRLLTDDYARIQLLLHETSHPLAGDIQTNGENILSNSRACLKNCFKLRVSSVSGELQGRVTDQARLTLAVV
jgi:hypothetical protein